MSNDDNKNMIGKKMLILMIISQKSARKQRQ